jgi:hypothetical protein
MIEKLDLFVLVTTGFICLLGIASSKFSDNLFQRIGLALLCMSCLARALAVYNYGVGQEIYVWLHTGMWFFAVGTWWKFSLRAWMGNRKRSLVWYKDHFPYDRRHKT